MTTDEPPAVLPTDAGCDGLTALPICQKIKKKERNQFANEMGLQLLHMLLGSDGPTGFSMPTFGPARCAKQQYNSNGQLT